MSFALHYFNSTNATNAYSRKVAYLGAYGTSLQFSSLYIDYATRKWGYLGSISPVSECIWKDMLGIVRLESYLFLDESCIFNVTICRGFQPGQPGIPCVQVDAD